MAAGHRARSFSYEGASSARSAGGWSSRGPERHPGGDRHDVPRPAEALGRRDLGGAATISSTLSTSGTRTGCTPQASARRRAVASRGQPQDRHPRPLARRAQRGRARAGVGAWPPPAGSRRPPQAQEIASGSSVGSGCAALDPLAVVRSRSTSAMMLSMIRTASTGYSPAAARPRASPRRRPRRPRSPRRRPRRGSGWAPRSCSPASGSPRSPACRRPAGASAASGSAAPAGGELDAEIAARDHDARPCARRSRRSARPRPASRAWRRAAPGRRRARAPRRDVLRPLHEGERQPVDAELEGEVEVLAVLLRQRRERQHDARTFTPLRSESSPPTTTRSRRTSGRSARPRAGILPSSRSSSAPGEGREDLGVRQARGVALGRVEVERNGRPLGGHRALGEGADAELGALQVGEDADRPAGVALDLPDRLVALLVIGVAAVAEVEPEHVGAGLEQGPDDLGRGAAGPRVATILALRLRRMALHQPLGAASRLASLQDRQRRQRLAEPLAGERVELAGELLVEDEHVDPVQEMRLVARHADARRRFADDELALDRLAGLALGPGRRRRRCRWRRGRPGPRGRRPWSPGCRRSAGSPPLRAIAESSLSSSESRVTATRLPASSAGLAAATPGAPKTPEKNGA